MAHRSVTQTLRLVGLVLLVIPTSLEGLTPLPSKLPLPTSGPPGVSASLALHETTKFLSRSTMMGDRQGYSVSLDGDWALLGAPFRDSDVSDGGSAFFFHWDGSAWQRVAEVTADAPQMGDHFGSSVVLAGNRALVGAEFDRNGFGQLTGAVYVFDFDGSSWIKTARLTGWDLETATALGRFGVSVSLSGDRALIGADAAYVDGLQAAGAAYLFDFDGNAWNPGAKLASDTPFPAAFFGRSVSLAGERALVGAPGDLVGTLANGRAYAFDFDGTDWTLTDRLSADDGLPNEQFGLSVSVAGDLAVVGAPGPDINGSGGAVYPFTFSGGSWGQLPKLTASDAQADSSFGSAVDILGERALVGAKYHDGDGVNSGSAYIFEYDGSAWTESQRLQTGEPHHGNLLGFAVSLEDDRALIGAPSPLDWSGAAHVFDLTMGSWQETQELNAGAPFEYFGQAVDLSGDRIMASVPTQNATGNQIGGVYLFQSDGMSWTEYPILLDPDNPSIGDQSRFGTAISLVGERALIGAPEESSTLEQAGMAFLFVKAGDYWGGYYLLQASDGEPFAKFGISVSLSGDRALIGAHRDTVSGVDKGSAYIFDFDGSNWVQTAKLTAADGASSDEFGTAVSLDGDRAVVGAPRRNEQGSKSGAAYVFEFDGVGWTQSAKLAASDGMANAYYGHQVKVVGDRIVVGAFGDQNFTGAAYIYDLDESTWSESKLPPPSAGAQGRFGWSIDLEGDQLLIGANRTDEDGSDSGSAYLFGYDGQGWTEVAKLTAGDAAEGDAFGSSVALSGHRALVSAPYKDDPFLGVATGSAYLFDLPSDDFGDAPDPGYPTLAASDGARHRGGSGLFLGAGVDVEGDGSPSVGADGDGADDGDGVAFAPMVAGLSSEIAVTASGPGVLDAWFDWNRDGDWNDSGEWELTAVPLSSGDNLLSLSVPGSAVAGPTYARFRFSSSGVAGPMGPAPDGEVEDYAITVDTVGMLISKTADSATLPEPGGVVHFTIDVSNLGSGEVELSALVDTLEGDLHGQGSCSLPQSIASGSAYSCQFDRLFLGNANDSETGVTTATGSSLGVNLSTAVGATVTLTDVWPSIETVANVTPYELPPPGGEFSIEVLVANTGTAEAVELNQLTDDQLGSLQGVGNCSLPQSLAIGAQYSCVYEVSLVGDEGDSEVHLISATVEDDEGNPEAESDSATLRISDATPPTIVSLAAAGAGGLVPLVDCLTATSPIDSLEVVFSEALQDLPGDQEPGDVDAAASYLLVEAGPDGEFSSLACMGPAGDDVGNAIATVKWDETSWTAQLELDTPRLVEGHYRLLLCSALRDLSGLYLDGDGNGSGGDDRVVTFRADPGNRFANGSLDCDLTSWTEAGGRPPTSWTWDPFEDISGSSLSGSAKRVDPGSVSAVLEQCVEVLNLLPHRLAAAIRTVGDEVLTELECVAFDGMACTGGGLGVQSSQVLVSDTAGAWQELQMTVDVDPPAASLMCRVGILNPAQNVLDVWLDRLQLIPLNAIFADGFESGSTNAW